ncbi:restriction endonuclease subunit S [Segatella copri]|uniref:Restriction endonuclease subunit S n=2 Tax=Segatella copri TaxID=165179 RepID=A0AA92TSK7_9BACT|nr:restriction endonuclease subunit S [Segatella copri]
MFVNVNRGGYAPLIRFKGYADKWIMVLLKDVSKKVTEKNSSFDYKDVFTNSAELGIINQRDYFDHDVANVESIQGYNKVAPNDYVYNPRISTSAPVGPINRNKLAYGGVMSPLYYVFRVDDKDFGSLDFLDFFFKSDVWHEFMFKNGNSGARSDRFSISDDVFVEMPIAHPKSKREQKTIGNFLASMDAALQNETYKLTKLRTMKQSLLQKMFV